MDLKKPGMRRWQIWVWGILICLPPAIFQLCLLASPVEVLVWQGSYDDTFLYLQIARNWSVHGFPTFDGEAWTNGFQPLWGLILLALTVLSKESGELFRLAYCTALIFYLCALWPLLRCAKIVFQRQSSQQTPAAAAQYAMLLLLAVWLLPLTVPRTISGMEDSLHCLIFSWLLLEAANLFLASGQRKNSRLLMFGIALGLNGLTRLDSGIISCLISLPFAVTVLHQRRWVSFLLIYGPPVVFLTLYCSLNWVYLGTPVPVSGSTKVFWAGIDQDGAYWIARKALSVLSHIWGEVLSLNRAVLLVALPSIAFSFFRADRKLCRAALWLLFVVNAHALLLYVLLRQFAINSLWYYSSLRATAALLIGFATYQILSSPKMKLTGSYVAAILLLALTTTGAFRITQSSTLVDAASQHWFAYRLDAALWLKNNHQVFAGKKVGAWNAGTLGFFANPVQVVNLDGLVQAPGYLEEVLRKNDWQHFLRCKNIGYLIDYNASDGTQTFGKDWDDRMYFRALVPLKKASIIAAFGPVSERKRTLVLDVNRWVIEDTRSCEAH